MVNIVSGVDTRVISIFETAATFQIGGALNAFPLTSLQLTTGSARATAALTVDADKRRTSSQTPAANAVQFAQRFSSCGIIHS
jgi:hypothetical protein